jgi:hypothetical protein
LDNVPESHQLFHPQIYIERLWGTVAKQRTAGLDLLVSLTIADPVSSIIEHLQGVPATTRVYPIGHGPIKFRAAPAVIGDARSHDEWRTSRQYCACIQDKFGERTPAYVAQLNEYHELTQDDLDRALRPTDIYDEVINRVNTPTDPDGDYRYRSELRVAGAVARIFDSMVQLGLTFGFITTGEAFFFLKLNWESMTLYYHLANPRREIAEDKKDVLCRSALSQILAFTIQALGTPRQPQRIRDVAKERLKTWRKGEDAVSENMPPSVETPPTRCSAADERKSGKEDGLLIAPLEPGRPRNSPSCRPPRYCTQKCLLGLVNHDGVGRGVLDEQCPNVSLHRQGNDTHHPVTHSEWLSLLRQQLE